LASAYAIAAVTQTILGVLKDTVPAEFVAAQFEPLQIADFQKPKPLEEGISLLLYRVDYSPVQRNLQQRAAANGSQRRPPLPVDLHYIVTPWGRTSSGQQRLLGWCLRTLEDIGTLNASLLNHFGGPDPVFKATETVDVVHEPIPMTDWSGLWDLLKPNAHVSVGYVARMVYIESEIEVPAGQPVQTRVFGMAREEENGDS
jgi:hypothetical protein